MDLKQAKSLDINDLLEKLGCHSVEEKYGKQWYYSPFRIENKPSFVVFTQQNRWYDFGRVEGDIRGGGAIELAKVYLKENSLASALQWLNDLIGEHGTYKKESIQSVSPNFEKNEALELLHSSILQDIKLLQYIKERCLPIFLARKYCQQVHYRHKASNYSFVAIGFKNIEGGYEIRTPRFKGTLGKKSFTLLPIEESTSLTIFEGFMDFLSWEHMKGKSRKSDALVLNGLGNHDKVITHVLEKGKQYQQINLCLDNDKPADIVTDKLLNAFSCKVIDRRAFYAPLKDFNEWCVDQHLNK